MPHEVKLDVFEGPIDLLLHLVTRQRVDIYEVSLATVTQEYLDAVARMEELDLDRATGFLVVAATLLELKSARLLPAYDGDDEGSLLDERDLLLARLVECATFREAGAWIWARLQEGALSHGRSAGLEPQFAGLAPDLLARVSVEQLARAAGRPLGRTAAAELDTSHVAPIRVSVADAVIDVAFTLEGAGPQSFARLCERVSTRLELVVRFLALLELFKAGAIELSQADRFGDITATWTGEVDPHEVAAEAEEYAPAAGAA
jgi:segregation and condensation protein A